MLRSDRAARPYFGVCLGLSAEAQLVVRIVALVTCVLAFSAGSAAADPLSVTSSEPPDSKVIAPITSYGTINLSVTTNVPHSPGGLTVELSSQNSPASEALMHQSIRDVGGATVPHSDGTLSLGRLPISDDGDSLQ